MQLIRLIAIMVIMLVLAAVAAHGQTVTVTQGFVDDASKAFAEVVALRKAVDALERERETKDKLILLQEQLVADRDRRIVARDEEIAALRKLSCSKISLFWVVSIKRCR